MIMIRECIFVILYNLYINYEHKIDEYLQDKYNKIMIQFKLIFLYYENKNTMIKLQNI